MFFSGPLLLFCKRGNKGSVSHKLMGYTTQSFIRNNGLMLFLHVLKYSGVVNMKQFCKSKCHVGSGPKGPCAEMSVM